MNIFRSALDFMALGILTILRAICATLKGVFHYAYLGMDWIDKKIKKCGYRIEQTTTETVFDMRHLAN